MTDDNDDLRVQTTLPPLLGDDDITYLQMSDFAKRIRPAASLNEVLIIGTQTEEIDDDTVCERLMIATGGGGDEFSAMMMLVRALFATAVQLAKGDKMQAYLSLQEFLPKAVESLIKDDNAAKKREMGMWVDDGTGLKRKR